MAGKNADGPADASFNKVVNEPRRPKASAQHREQLLFLQMCSLISAGVLDIPRFGRHAC